MDTEVQATKEDIQEVAQALDLKEVSTVELQEELLRREIEGQQKRLAQMQFTLAKLQAKKGK